MFLRNRQPQAPRHRRAWSNVSFPTQTTNFTASFDATPSQSGADIVIGLGPTAAAAYTDLAAIVRFNSSNTIDVRNGSAYGADVSVPYSAGTDYHVRMVVNVATDTYSVYVTPQGGSEIELAANYAFRTEQATDTSLSDLAESATLGWAAVSNFSIAGTPAITSVVQSPSSGDLNAGHVVTLTLNLSEAVTVAGGTPTLTLNDGGTATYTGGSGTNALTFSYTVAAGQNTSALAVTAVNLNSATITDGTGNAANLSLTGLTQTGPQIDTTAPTVSSVVASGTGITAGAGDLTTGSVVTLTRQPERGGDGRGRHADADAQRRRHRDLYGRLGLERADLQLHGGGRPEHRRPGGDGGQSQHGDRHGRRRQCRQSHRRGDQPGRHPADRHHGADGVVGGGVGHRHHRRSRRPQRRQAWSR